MKKIKKLLIANRGEIALRIMRTARDLNIKTVAVFSEIDRTSPHVKYADEAFCIGPPPAADSYLSGHKIIELCKKHGIDAIHPGYGFLSENADFAQEVTREGIIFVGPSPEAIRLMGDKLSAKSTVAKFNVPLVPGGDGAIKDLNEATEIANKIGYPVIIKASAGGGGKGMRIVYHESELDEQMKRAISEATSSFGDGAIFIEKFITSPRHIEIQVLGDQSGNIIHLFERECSIQRRHQKIIEEAPSSILTDAEREAMGEAAVKVAKACGYFGAGTVEFIFDENRNFYFLEMNTRLQVEHPVTEMITGIDLVQEQLKIAEGMPLNFKQDDVHIHGHAIEIRVYAEDPANNFLPDIGQLQTYRPPKGPGVRLDDCFLEGMDISIYYDPMIAKLITYGLDRDMARNRMIRAIRDYEITGIENTLDFCRFVMEHNSFIKGDFDTNFVSKHFSPESLNSPQNKQMKKIAAAFAIEILQEQSKQKKSNQNGLQKSKWKNRLIE